MTSKAYTMDELRALGCPDGLLMQYIGFSKQEVDALIARGKTTQTVREERREWFQRRLRLNSTPELHGLHVQELENDVLDGIEEIVQRALSAPADTQRVLEEIRAEIERGKSKSCLGCCNGNDIPEEELCRACWRIWIDGKMYLLWDYRETEKRLESLTTTRPDNEQSGAEPPGETL